MLRVYPSHDADYVDVADEELGTQGEGLRAKSQEWEVWDDYGGDAWQLSLRPRDDQELRYHRLYDGPDPGKDRR